MLRFDLILNTDNIRGTTKDTFSIEQVQNCLKNILDKDVSLIDKKSFLHDVEKYQWLAKNLISLDQIVDAFINAGNFIEYNNLKNRIGMQINFSVKMIDEQIKTIDPDNKRVIAARLDILNCHKNKKNDSLTSYVLNTLIPGHSGLLLRKSCTKEEIAQFYLLGIEIDSECFSPNNKFKLSEFTLENFNLTIEELIENYLKENKRKKNEFMEFVNSIQQHLEEKNFVEVRRLLDSEEGKYVDLISIAINLAGDIERSLTLNGCSPELQGFFLEICDKLMPEKNPELEQCFGCAINIFTQKIDAEKNKYPNDPELIKKLTLKKYEFYIKNYFCSEDLNTLVLMLNNIDGGFNKLSVNTLEELVAFIAVDRNDLQERLEMANNIIAMIQQIKKENENQPQEMLERKVVTQQIEIEKFKNEKQHLEKISLLQAEKIDKLEENGKQLDKKDKEQAEKINKLGEENQQQVKIINDLAQENEKLKKELEEAKQLLEKQKTENNRKKFIEKVNSELDKITQDIFSKNKQWKLGLFIGGINVTDNKTIEKRVSETANKILDKVEKYKAEAEKKDKTELQNYCDAMTILTDVELICGEGQNRSTLYRLFHRQKESSRTRYNEYFNALSAIKRP